MDPHLDEKRESKASKRIKAELAELELYHHNGIVAGKKKRTSSDRHP